MTAFTERIEFDSVSATMAIERLTRISLTESIPAPISGFKLVSMPFLRVARVLSYHEEND